MRGSAERGTRPVSRVVATTTNRGEKETDAAPFGTNPEPSVAVEVTALSPTSRFACEACGKEFLLEQSLHLHRRGHAHGGERLPQGSGRRAYVCPDDLEASCARHEAGTGRRYRRRSHGERKWKCDLCGKRYAADYDWEAHARVCGVGNKSVHRLLPPPAQALVTAAAPLVSTWAPRT